MEPDQLEDAREVSATHVDSVETHNMFTSGGRARDARPRRVRWAFVVAAAVVGILAIGIDPMHVYDYETAGEDRVIDCRNNRIILHRESHIAIQCSRNLLRARLVQGEVSLQVAHDDSSATIVVAGDAQVDAVGATFAVRRDPDRSIVTVLHGSVMLSALDPGEETTASLNGGRSRALRPVQTIDEMPVWAGESAAVVNTGSAVLLTSSRKVRAATANQAN